MVELFRPHSFTYTLYNFLNYYECHRLLLLLINVELERNHFIFYSQTDSNETRTYTQNNSKEIAKFFFQMSQY